MAAKVALKAWLVKIDNETEHILQQEIEKIKSLRSCKDTCILYSAHVSPERQVLRIFISIRPANTRNESIKSSKNNVLRQLLNKKHTEERTLFFNHQHENNVYTKLLSSLNQGQTELDLVNTRASQP